MASNQVLLNAKFQQLSHDWEKARDLVNIDIIRGTIRTIRTIRTIWTAKCNTQSLSPRNTTFIFGKTHRCSLAFYMLERSNQNLSRSGG